MPCPITWTAAFCALAVLAGVLALAGLSALGLLVLQMCAQAQEAGISTRCVLGVCLAIAPGTVLLSWPP